MNLKGGGPEKFGPIRSFLYERWAEPSLEPLHRRIVSEIPVERGRLLDVGCGPGSLDRMLAEDRPCLDVVGLDESEEMVRRASRTHRLPNLGFRRGSIEKFSAGEEFDFALSVLSFHHWEEPISGLEAVHRALKPGGRLWIYEGDPEASLEVAPLLPQLFRRQGLAVQGQGQRARAEEADHNGMLPCFFGGSSSRLLRSIISA